jgi:hypothetical protein
VCTYIAGAALYIDTGQHAHAMLRATTSRRESTLFNFTKPRQRARQWAALGSTGYAGLPVLGRAIAHLATSWRVLPMTLLIQGASALLVVAVTLAGHSSLTNTLVSSLSSFGTVFAWTFVGYLLQYAVSTNQAIVLAWIQTVTAVETVAARVTAGVARPGPVLVEVARLLDSARHAVYVGSMRETALARNTAYTDVRSVYAQFAATTRALRDAKFENDDIDAMLQPLLESVNTAIAVRRTWLPQIINDVIFLFVLLVFVMFFPLAWYATTGWWYLLMNFITTHTTLIVYNAATDTGDPLGTGDPRAVGGSIDLTVDETPASATEGMYVLERTYIDTRWWILSPSNEHQQSW